MKSTCFRLRVRCQISLIGPLLRQLLFESIYVRVYTYCLNSSYSNARWLNVSLVNLGLTHSQRVGMMHQRSKIYKLTSGAKRGG